MRTAPGGRDRSRAQSRPLTALSLTNCSWTVAPAPVGTMRLRTRHGSTGEVLAFHPSEFSGKGSLRAPPGNAPRRESPFVAAFPPAPSSAWVGLTFRLPLPISWPGLAQTRRELFPLATRVLGR